MSQDPRQRRDDKPKKPAPRRVVDARVGRPTRRAFRPLAWAWLLLLVALFTPAYDLFLPAGWNPPRERRTVVIERGQSLHEIALELQRVGVIRSQFGFLVLARAMQLDRSVKAGQYSFRIGMTVPALLRALDRGMYGLNLVTIPEGLMISETAALLERQIGIPSRTLDSLAHDPDMLDSLGVAAPSLEGWLAPDSYEWLPGTNPDVVLRTMVARTRERVQRATAGYDSLPLGMNAHEVLTLASIVESESRAREERPHIARVYLNRLERGMLLQADPTVGYALGRGPRSRLTFKDLRVVSPYNTYRHEGLPPGPICSPGLAAIEAVMNATPGANDLYFVARGGGRHVFAPTYQQHLANIAMVRGRQAALAAETNPDAGSTDAEPDSAGANAPAASLAARTTSTAPKPAVTAAPAKPANPLNVATLSPRSQIKTASASPVPETAVPPAARALRGTADSSAHLLPRLGSSKKTSDSTHAAHKPAGPAPATVSAPLKLVPGAEAASPKPAASKPAADSSARKSTAAKPAAPKSTAPDAAAAPKPAKPAPAKVGADSTVKRAAKPAPAKASADSTVKRAARPAPTKAGADSSVKRAAKPAASKPAADSTAH